MRKFAKQLRKNEMPTEAVLWHRLRSRQLVGLKFRRQHSFFNYVLDFFCIEKQLAIEIDGDVHCLENVKLNDQTRQQFIESKGVTVLRFTTEDIVDNIEGVLEAIVVGAFPDTPHPSPLPEGEGRTNEKR